MVRERFCEPLPHDLLHVVHGVQVPMSQFTAQA
jgi:hypothetical protein